MNLKNNHSLEEHETEVRKCLWCNLSEENLQVTFNKKAHTIPQSLGGKFLCNNVCDRCNHYFGSPEYNRPSVEVVLREGFELTRYMAFSNEKKKSNNYARFKSTFFKLNTTNRTFSLKPIYSIKPGFQASMARQFKRGIFKIFLEEYQRQTNNGMEGRFDFIREFARYDLNDIPIFYMTPKIPVLFYIESEFIAPELNFHQTLQKKIDDYEFYDLNIFGHGFLIPTYRNWNLTLESNIRKAKNDLKGQYIEFKLIESFEDVDFSLKFMGS
jgi:hypothetical protein